MQIKHLFFDLDRTLWDFEKNSHDELVSLYHKYQLHQKGISLADEFIKVYKKINNKCWEKYRKNLITKDKLRTERFLQTLIYFGIENKKLADDLGTDYVNNSPHRTILIDGTIDLLKRLEVHFSMHIITNGFEEVQWVKLEKSGLLPYFDKVITSEKVGVKKPDVKIFHYAMSEANASLNESIMIGDDLKTDIAGAIDVGMRCIYYNPNNHHHNLTIWKQVSSLSEIKNILL